MRTARETFGREEHLRRRRDFLQAYAEGTRLRGRYMTLFVRPTAGTGVRLGIAATKKQIGRAVDRNLAKRLIREIFRLNKPAWVADLVVIPHRDALGVPFATLEAEYRTLVARWRPQARGPRAGARPRAARGDVRRNPMTPGSVGSA